MRDVRPLRTLLPGGFHCCADTVPAVPGAYVLLIETTTSACLKLPRLGKAVLAPGRFLYCGSAYGAGGLRARLRRHMRSEKALHWHVDRLAAQGRAVGAWVFPDGRECDLWLALSALPAMCPGFGASDCTNGCASHLRAWPVGRSAALGAALAECRRVASRRRTT